VDALIPLYEAITLAARPVGARRTVEILCSFSVRTIAPIEVVLPVPAYPLIIRVQRGFVEIINFENALISRSCPEVGV
jgi:hypothetical protein